MTTSTIEQRTRPTPPEQRTVDVDVQNLEARGRTVVGYAAVYGATSEDLGGFRERIAPGAFADVLNGDTDVRCLLNHDANIVLGRTRSGTLRLSDEQRGLRFECDLPESRDDLREAIARGDLDGASFRFRVGEDEWDGDELRTVRRIAELFDISLATVPAYPEASVELRTRSQNEPPRRSSNGGGLRVRDRGLRVEDRSAGAAPSLTEAFRRAGWPEQRAEVPFGEFRALTLAAGNTAAELAPSQQAGVALGADQRYAYPAFPQIGVDSGVTSVNVVRQSLRELPVSGVVRDIDATGQKAETGSEVAITPTALHQVASVESGVPNVYLETDAVRTIIETDLRLAVNEGLDSLVLDALATADNEDPTGTTTLAAIRAAMTTIQGAGYSPNLLILDPATAEALDVLVSGIAGGDNDFVFAPAQLAPDRIFNLRRVVSKSAPAPVVCDASAVGRLYTSPVSLQRFEENDGATNSSLLRLELHALFGVERLAAAVRIAAA